MADANDKREAAIKRLEAKRVFRLHAAIYVAVNVGLIIIWAMTSGGYFWPIWPILGWGIRSRSTTGPSSSRSRSPRTRSGARWSAAVEAAVALASVAKAEGVGGARYVRFRQRTICPVASTLFWGSGMRRTEALQGVRMGMFLNLLHRFRVGGAQSGGGGRSARGRRTNVPTVDAPLRGGRRGRPCRPAARQGVGQAGSDGSGGGGGRLDRERHQGFTIKPFHDHLVKDHGLRLGLHLAEAALAGEGRGGQGAAQGGASQEARAAYAAGDDAASGRLAARLDRGRARP
jgi:hypothetical protein